MKQNNFYTKLTCSVRPTHTCIQCVQHGYTRDRVKEKYNRREDGINRLKGQNLAARTRSTDYKTRLATRSGSTG